MKKLGGFWMGLTSLSAAISLWAAPLPSSSDDIKDLYDGWRAYHHAAALVELGPRVPGGETEKMAASYIAGVMESYGLEVEIQEFDLTHYVDLGSTLEVAGGAVLTPKTMLYSPPGTYENVEIVFCGIGHPEDYEGKDVTGKIVLLERGVLYYNVKAANASDAGAAAVVVHNSTPGIHAATLGSVAAIPAVSLSQEEGLQLRAMLDAGPVYVNMSVDAIVDENATSQNVIGTLVGNDPSQGIVYLGAHYDSLWDGPGANDNGSGLGAVLEAARVLSAKGHTAKASIKFCAFGGEEFQMLGSFAYVIGNFEEVTTQGVGMVNLDSIAVGDTLSLGTTPFDDAVFTLAEFTWQKAEAMGVENWEAVDMGANSDHAYFAYFGVPAVFCEQGPDPNDHSGEDTLDKLDVMLLERNGELATAVVYDWAKNPAKRARKAAKADKDEPGMLP